MILEFLEFLKFWIIFGSWIQDFWQSNVLGYNFSGDPCLIIYLYSGINDPSW